MKFQEHFSCYDLDHMFGNYKQWYWRFYKCHPCVHHECTYTFNRSFVIEKNKKKLMSLLKGDIIMNMNDVFIYNGVKLELQIGNSCRLSDNLKIIKDFPIDYWKGFMYEYYLDKSLFEITIKENILYKYFDNLLVCAYYISFTYNYAVYYITNGKDISSTSKEDFLQELKQIQYVKILDCQNNVLVFM